MVSYSGMIVTLNRTEKDHIPGEFLSEDSLDVGPNFTVLDVEALFDKLAELGTGFWAFCSLTDDEANAGHGGAWEFRLNHPELELTGPEIVQRDFTKREWS